MKFAPGKVGAKLAVLVVAAGSVSLFGALGASALGTNAGPATIVDQSHAAPLNAGGSQTTWSITLPKLAACSGDTANQAYHVFGYIVPLSVDPATVTYDANGPTTGFPLVDTTGSPFVNSNTAIGTGQVVTIPDFNWAFFGTADKSPPAVLNPGQYNVGIACAKPDNTTDKFWNVVETFTANAGDPNGETWTAANPSTQTPEAALTILLPLSTVAILAGGAVIIGRRRKHQELSFPS
jgi:hypothetical protein